MGKELQNLFILFWCGLYYIILVTVISLHLRGKKGQKMGLWQWKMKGNWVWYWRRYGGATFFIPLEICVSVMSNDEIWLRFVIMNMGFHFGLQKVYWGR